MYVLQYNNFSLLVVNKNVQYFPGFHYLDSHLQKQNAVYYKNLRRLWLWENVGRLEWEEFWVTDDRTWTDSTKIFVFSFSS
jgi:hypothetical protein